MPPFCQISINAHPLRARHCVPTGGIPLGLETPLRVCYAERAKESNTRASLGDKGRSLRA